MTPTTLQRIEPARLMFWPAAITSLVLTAAGMGAVAPLVPIVAVAGLSVILASRIQVTAISLLALALILDNPGERPMDDRWQSPLYALGVFVYENMRKFTGVEALRFSALEAVLILLIVIILIRKFLADPIDDPHRLSALPNPMKKAFGWFWVAIAFLEVYGLATGGDFKNSLWQFRQLFWLPLLGVLFGNACKTQQARKAVLLVLVFAAWVRCLVGLYFCFAIARPQGLDVPYITTHSDTVLTVVSILIGAALLVESPSITHIFLNLIVQPVYLLGLLENGRRIAFVELAAGAAAMILMGPTSFRRLLKRSLVVILPLIAIYVAIGWNSRAGIFKPVASLRSVSTSEDASSQTRDIENFNLIQTLKRHPVLGSGFGHEYIEFVQANRVDQIFAQYRYIAHNSVLWLLSLSGWFGFTLLWMVFPVAVLIALRVHRQSNRPVDRVISFAATAAVICFLIQAWGDMGLVSWMGTIVFASLTGTCGAIFTAQQQEEPACP